MSSLSLDTAANFYQRHERKFILVVVVLLSIYLIAFAAKLTWWFIPGGETNTTQTQANSRPAQSNQATSTEININQVLDLNLFGNAAAQPVQAVEEVSAAPQTKLNLVLSGVVASDQVGRGAAIIEYRNTQNTYGIGDKIEGTNVTLDEIYTDRVIIKNGLTRETLMLEGLDFDEANTRLGQQVQTSQRTPQPQVGPSNRPDPRVLRDARQQLAESPDSFTELISMAPHRVDGQLIGYRVTPGTNPALFNSVGLQNGDIVTNLNGLDLTDLQQSLEALTELQEAQSLELEILRAGEYISLNFEIPDET